MGFVVKHGPFEKPIKEVAKECDECDVVLVGNDGKLWLGVLDESEHDEPEGS